MKLKPNSILQLQERGKRYLEFVLPGVAGTLILVMLFIYSGDEGPHRISGSHEYPAFQNIELKVNRKALWKLRTKREKALDDKVLMHETGDWVPGTLVENGQKWSVKLRLKGDWTDHLNQGKWSFRVQVKGNQTFHRLKVFSLQSPLTRSLLDEWFFHQVLIQEGVLTTRYDFVRLHFNGAELGIYALEEHFTKELIESQGQREGPILKMNEDGLWEARKLAIKDSLFPYLNLPLYEAAQPEAFNYDNLLQKPTQLSLHTQAQALLHTYKYGLNSTARIFDLGYTARVYALIDLFKAHHSLIWHNRRFYYEPVHSRLKPIVYDAFSGDISEDYISGPFTGFAMNGETYKDGRLDLLDTRFFAEDEFTTTYYEYLHQFTSPKFLDSLNQRLGNALKERLNFLRREFLFYRYPVGKLQGYAEEIRKSLVIDPMLLEFSSENGLCMRNYNPVPILVNTGSEGEEILLDAYDGRGLADHVQLSDLLLEVDCRIPGGKTRSIAVSRY